MSVGRVKEILGKANELLDRLGESEELDGLARAQVLQAVVKAKVEAEGLLEMLEDKTEDLEKGLGELEVKIGKASKGVDFDEAKQKLEELKGGLEKVIKKA